MFPELDSTEPDTLDLDITSESTKQERSKRGGGWSCISAGGKGRMIPVCCGRPEIREQISQNFSFQAGALLRPNFAEEPPPLLGAAIPCYALAQHLEHGRALEGQASAPTLSQGPPKGQL